MKFASFCSGIEAASCAWEPLGWKPVLLSEIEAFPREVLRVRHGAVDAQRSGSSKRGVPLWGDFTALRPRHFARLGIESPDILVAGTPCQAFSLAGKRESLDDARGNLTLQFVRQANAIDNLRRHRGEEPLIVCWENVPGCLNTKDNAFGCFLAGLVGADAPLKSPLERGRWSDAGMVTGPRRSAAWRVLDAQYFGLAQRRRRVFLVASARDGFDPAAILFESLGVRGDTPKGDEAGACVAALTANGVGTCGADDNQGQAGYLIPVGFNNTGHGWWNEADSAATIRKGDDNGGGGARESTIVCMSTGQASAEIGIGTTLNCNHDVPMIAGCLNANGKAAGSATQQDAENGMLVPMLAHTLRGEGFDASEDGTGRGTPLIPVAFRVHGEHSTAMQGDGVANVADPCDVARCLDSQGGFATNQGGNVVLQPAVAFAENSRAEVRLEGGDGQRTGALSTGGGKAGQGVPCAMQGSAVRRLTPVEAERLQGFEDNYTRIPWRGKPAEQCPDGPRYRAIGNSMARNVMEWIGRRIKAVVCP